MSPPVILTAAMAAAFCAIHLFIGSLHFLEAGSRSRWLSFAGGVAVAFVFMHMLPDLGTYGLVFAETTALPEALAESAPFALALAGLALFYGVEHALVASRRNNREAGDHDRPERGIFWLHIASSSLLIAVIAYLLNHREESGLIGVLIYFIAMALHFGTADFGSHTHHPDLYQRGGRWALVAATLGGWLIGLLVTLPHAIIGALYAFVGGGIILTVLKEELPAEKESRFVWFLAGTVGYAALVLVEEALAGAA